MESILFIILLIVLLLITYQDVKERQVHWVLFPMAAVLSVFYFHQIIAFTGFAFHVPVNVLLIGVLLVCLIGYVLLRFKNKGTRLWNYLGLGDVLFFLVIACSFSPFNFILFTILSLIFSLLASAVHDTKKPTVPLAGYQALCLSLFLIVQRIFSLNPFNDYWIYQWI